MDIPKTSRRNNRILRILVIDDEKTSQDSLSMLLSSLLRCHIRIADTGEEGVELAIKHKFNLIFSDVDLPGMSGVATVCLIRNHLNSKNKTTPIITVSGNISAKEKCIAAGAAAFVDKLSINKQLKKALEEFGFLSL